MFKLNKKLTITTAVLASLALTACSSANKVQTVKYTEGTQESLYADAANLILANNFNQASDILTQLRIQYPLGEVSNKVTILQAYNYFKLEKYDLALSTINNYFANADKTKPVENGDYLLVLHAQASVDANRSLAQRLVNLDVSENDLANANTAITDLQTLITTYPKSSYIPYAGELVSYLGNLLAKHNLETAKFYVKYNNPLAAFKRANVVLVNFKNSQYAPEAIKILESSSKTLGVNFSQEAAQISKEISALPKHDLLTKKPEAPSLLPPFIAATKANAVPDLLKAPAATPATPAAPTAPAKPAPKK